MAEPAVTEARDAASAAMRRLRDAAAKVLTTLAEAQPVAPQHLMVLNAVDGGARTPSEVAVACDRHASSISRVLDQLVELGLVGRQQDPADRRQVLLALTDEGARVVRRFQQLDMALSARMLHGFDADDASRLAGYLDRITTNAAELAVALEDDLHLLDDIA